jgi:chemotaxis protein histidine kinase CheA/CheY-like chemotaxis protein
VISKTKYLGIFLDEFRENLLSAENQIILLKGDQGNEDALATLLRTLHNMKGSARMLQFENIEGLIHGAETVFKGVRDGRYAVDHRIVRFFFIVADRLRFAAEGVERDRGDAFPDRELLIAASEKLGANEAFDLSSIPSLPQAEDGLGGDSVGERAVAVDAATQGAEEAGGETLVGSGRIDSSIRVDSAVIDRSISLVNTLTIRQLRLRSAADQLEGLEKRLAASYQGPQDARSLRKELASLTRIVRQYRSQYTEQLFEIDHGTQELRDTVIGMRMLPLSAILERFPRMVEETASVLGKDVALTIAGDTVRLDRTVLAKLSDPLIHLVRNAIDHGIEPAEARVQAGKAGRGSIRIECRTEGSRISIVVSDDGRGLDYPGIRAKALSLWPDDEADIKAMSDTDLVRFLFRPGFSTKATSTSLSGRGIGLDVVKTNVKAIKGNIHLASTPGEGSSFTLLLPVSASTMDGMFVLCSGKKYFIPASYIARTLLVDSADCFRIRQKEMFNLEGTNVPLSDLALGLQVEQQERKSKKLSVLLIRGTSDTAGLVVDRILGYDSFVYQPLPPGLRKNNLVQGIVFDGSFNIIPILNMWSILDRLRAVRAMDTHRRFIASKQQERPTVLVVDDSISTREIEISMLELEGYDVVGAVDGVDALEKIRARRFDVIVSDLNMPRMDGLKLLENIRNDDSLKALPVVLVTTVEEPEVRKKAERLGASKYILKSSFEQDDLVGALRELVSAVGARAEADAETGIGARL